MDRNWIPFFGLARLLGIAGVLFGFATSQAVEAQVWPSKPIRIIVTFAPGTSPDIMSRFLAESLTAQLNTPVLVENSDGAGGIIGAQVVARAPADGHTVLAMLNATLSAPQLSKVMPYDPIRDFVPVAKVAYEPFTIVTSGQSEFKTIKELFSFIKANPGKANYATGGKGTLAHLEIEYIMQVLGLSAVDVPYKSSATSLADTITNTVTFAMIPYSRVPANVATGKLRLLAVSTRERLQSAPDVPTYIEATGISNYAPVSWVGYSMVKGTQPDIVSKLEQAVGRAMADSSLQKKMAGTPFIINFVPGREFGAEMSAEFDKFSRLISTLNLKGQ